MASGAQRKAPSADGARVEGSGQGQPNTEPEQMEPKGTTPEASTVKSDNSSTDAAPADSSSVSPKVATPPEGPEKPMIPTVETVTSATGIVQTITNEVEPPVRSDVDPAAVEETTIVRVRPGRCATHAVRTGYLTGGEEFLAGEAYGGVVGALAMLRKGILEVVPSRAKPVETPSQ